MKKLKQGAYFSDIHFGRKSNSEQHNQDCLDFIDWFCERVKENDCDYVAFLGDWNENRSALNIQTLNYSYKGAKKINDLGVPVFFLVGNHDLYLRHTREIHSVVPFAEFSNFKMIDHPHLEENIEGNVLFVPFLFEEEYEELLQPKYLKTPVWAGHFEFRGFEITAYGTKMLTGPDPGRFKGPKHIVSGHFHKRQSSKNVTYIGNTFPMDFGDAGDYDRGMMIYDHTKHKMNFINWEQCPKYVKVTLTDILEEKKIPDNARVKCIVDVPITYEEGNVIKKRFSDKFHLRELVFEDTAELEDAISNTETNVNVEDQLLSVDELVLQMLKEIEFDQIDNDTLVKIYTDLK